jgi:hypothetical protein
MMSTNINMTDFDYYLVKYQLATLRAEQLIDIYNNPDLYQSFLRKVQAVSEVYHDEFSFLNQEIADKQFDFITANREKYTDPATRKVENAFLWHLNKGLRNFNQEAYLVDEAVIRTGNNSRKYYYPEKDLLYLVTMDLEYLQQLHTDDLEDLLCNHDFIGTVNLMLKRTPNIFLDQDFNILVKTLVVIGKSLSMHPSIGEIVNKHFYKKLVRHTHKNMDSFFNAHNEEVTQLVKQHLHKNNKPIPSSLG